jgi:hypothetical protein
MKTQFITDKNGEKIGVILPIKKYQQILEELEMLEDQRLYDEVKSLNEPAIPFEKAIKKLDAKRKKK